MNTTHNSHHKYSLSIKARNLWYISLIALGLLFSIRGVLAVQFYPAGIILGVYALFGASSRFDDWYLTVFSLIGMAVYATLYFILVFSNDKAARLTLIVIAILSLINIYGCNHAYNALGL